MEISEFFSSLLEQQQQGSPDVAAFSSPASSSGPGAGATAARISSADGWSRVLIWVLPLSSLLQRSRRTISLDRTASEPLRCRSFPGRNNTGGAPRLLLRHQGGTEAVASREEQNRRGTDAANDLPPSLVFMTPAPTHTGLQHDRVHGRRFSHVTREYSGAA